MAWTPLLLYTAYHSGCQRQQSLLQSILRKRTIIFPAGRPVWTFTKKRYSKMDAIRLFPLWIFKFLLCHVFSDALEYILGICRDKRFKHGGNIAVDVSASVASGLSRHIVFGRRSAICIWFLQRNAYLHDSGFDYHDLMQTTFLVRILPDGDDDAVNM